MCTLLELKPLDLSLTETKGVTLLYAPCLCFAAFSKSVFPAVSELRIVLLGSNWTEKSEVGNLLLGNTVFSSKTKAFVRISGTLGDKKIAVINTPYLPPLHTSHHDLTEFINDCAKLSAPGPHVFLLLVQPEKFTEEHKRRLCRVLQGYNDQSFDHSLILISAPREESSSSVEDFMKSSALNEMIKKCKCRYLKRSNVELPELLTHLGEITKDNNGEHVSYEAFEDTEQDLSKDQQPIPKKEMKTPIIDAVKAAGKMRNSSGKDEIHRIYNIYDSIISTAISYFHRIAQ